jgi:hypothetical protein
MITNKQQEINMKKRLFKASDSDVSHWLRVASFLIFMAAFPLSVYAASAGDEKSSPESLQPQTGLTLDMAGQVNPEGLRLKAVWFGKWIQETGEDGSAAGYLQSGLGLSASPAYVKGSIYGEWQPAVFLNLHMEYDLSRYLGANTGLLSFPDKGSGYGKKEVDALEGAEESATGQKVSFQPTLYAKAGPVIIVNQTDLAYYSFNGHGPYFLELEYDMLLKNGDYLIDNSTQFLFPVLKGKGSAVMYLGPYYNITHAYDAGITRQRVGAQLYWVIGDTKWGMKKPRVYSQTSINIQDRNRKGELYFAIGFGADF